MPYSNRKALRRLYEARDPRLAGIPDSTIRSHLGLTPGRKPSVPSLALALRYQRAVGLPLEGWLSPAERKWVAS
jgi:hypothetical protein